MSDVKVQIPADHYRKLREYRTVLVRLLEKQSPKAVELCKAYLQRDVAGSLQEVVEGVSNKILGVDLAGLFEVLGQLDRDVCHLRSMQGAPDAKETVYEERARYLSTVMPDPGQVKRLAREAFSAADLAHVQEYVADFQIGDSLSISFEGFRTFFRRHRLSLGPVAQHGKPRESSLASRRSDNVSGPPASGSIGRVGRLFSAVGRAMKRVGESLLSILVAVARLVLAMAWWAARLGFRRKLLSTTLYTRDALGLLRVSTSAADFRDRQLSTLEETYVDRFRDYVLREGEEEVALVGSIDAIISRHMPDVGYLGFARRVCERIVEELKAAVREERAARGFLRARTPVLSFGRLVASPGVPPGLVFWTSLGAGFLASWSNGAVPWLSWVLIGVFFFAFSVMSSVLAKRKLRLALEQEMVAAANDLLERTVRTTRARITYDLVSDVVEEIEIQLRLRPLQRALEGSLE